jgi:hypothetical protein
MVGFTKGFALEESAGTRLGVMSLAESGVYLVWIIILGL